jgi:hypothetical protein
MAPEGRGYDRSFQVPWGPVLATLLVTIGVTHAFGARRRSIVDAPPPAAAFGAPQSSEADPQQGAPVSAPSESVAEPREMAAPSALPLAAASPEVAHAAPAPETSGAPAMPVPPPSSLAIAPSPFAEAPAAVDPGPARREMVAPSANPIQSVFDAPGDPAPPSEPERQPAPPVAVPSLTSSAFDDEDLADDHPVDDEGRSPTRASTKTIASIEILSRESEAPMRLHTMALLATASFAGSSTAYADARAATLAQTSPTPGATISSRLGTPRGLPPVPASRIRSNVDLWSLRDSPPAPGVSLLASGQWVPVRDGRWIWIAYGESSRGTALSPAPVYQYTYAPASGWRRAAVTDAPGSLASARNPFADLGPLSGTPALSFGPTHPVRKHHGARSKAPKVSAEPASPGPVVGGAAAQHAR